MTTETFAVVFAGELSPGADLASAKQKLANLFKADLARIEPLFNGKQHTLKKNLSQIEAQRYKQVLQDAGLEIQLQAESNQGLSLAPAYTSHEPAKRMQCPKCLHEQDQASSCQACGIVIEKYLARQAENPPSNNTPYATPSAPLEQDEEATGPLKFFSISGRIGRLRYLAWSMAVSLLLAILYGASVALPPVLMVILVGTASLAALAAVISITVQRLHDIGWSGWLGLLMIIPLIGSVLGLILIFVPGSQKTNSYGAPPPANNLGVVILAFLLPLIFVIGVLSAIAIPAYQDYVQRAQAAQQR